MARSDLKEYEVHGPFSATRNNAREFGAARTDDYSSISNKYGCYVHATKFGESYRPWHEGRTRRSFQKEIFTPHKQDKLNQVWKQFERGELVVFPIAPQQGPGRPNLKFVREMEKHLISSSYEMNQDLPRASWRIVGVTSTRRGRPANNAATKFRNMLDL